MRYLLDVLYLLVGLAVSPMVLYRAVRHGRYRTGWRDRLGNVHRRYPYRPCIWLHAVSVGEVNAARSLVEEMERQLDAYEIVITTTTDTGYARAEKLFGHKHCVFYFPLDFSLIVRRALTRLNPAICLLMELEVWPNFVCTASDRGVPVIVVNGRISDRSFAQYRRVRRVIRVFFRRIHRVLAQTAEYADRFQQLGVPTERVQVTSSLKYDTAYVADRVEGAAAMAEQLGLQDAPLWVAGGTGNGEEAIILDVYRSLVQDPHLANVRLAIVPRKPERFREVTELIEASGLPLVRYSRLKGTSNRAEPNPRAVILGDTMGDLRTFYSLARVIFVGRTLVPMGGSDMMEAAALGRCTLFGPHTFNFRQTVDALLAGEGAIAVADSNELLDALRRCLADRPYATRIAKAGQDVIRQNQGATARTMEAIRQILGTTQPAGVTT
jgi:3-deoxy-D-manno-octulosonic-acid transferase